MVHLSATLPMINPVHISVTMGQAAFRMQMGMQRTALELGMGMFYGWRDACTAMLLPSK